MIRSLIEEESRKMVRAKDLWKAAASSNRPKAAEDLPSMNRSQDEKDEKTAGQEDEGRETPKPSPPRREKKQPRAAVDRGGERKKN